ncbi:MFS transporter [Nonomuraea endophytica]|uniref:DHA2 family multidrug resistance protein-like MFS transporter n=1 Tax=Nonomuraea endophytica TaxID=714136 RepID=A0A7W8AGR6_9ACTN|nr:MFS transporter [Nonomuraea endophytica]MBB5084845.1 DHA2 family multidrug resistance protein-like MFS transporter [Nonomuraea endophytica]
MPDTSKETARAGWKQWAGLAVLALPAMLVMIDMSVLHLAMPRLSADLDPSASQLLWITDIYGFLIAGALIPMGALGDRVGRRRVLLVGAATFGAASVLAAYAPTAETLIAARALLGLAGAALGPSTLSLISVMFHDPRQRTTAITVWMASFMAGGAVGPLVGGVMLEYFWWGSVFLAAVPVMVLLVVLGPILLPEYRDSRPARLDLPSAAMSLTAALAVVYGIKEMAKDGFAPVPVVAVVLGLVVGFLFVLRQRRLADPLLDLSLFANRAFTVSLSALTITVIFMLGTQFLMAQYMQMVLGLSPLRAGLWGLPLVIAGTVAIFVASALAAKIHRAYIFGTGLVVAAAGFAVLTQADAAAGLPVVVTGSVLLFAGLMPVSGLGIDMIVGAAPPPQAGAAAAAGETIQELGGALGIALLGSLVNAVYHGRMTAVAPDHLPAAAETLPAALAVARSLPGPAGDELAAFAREAFADGLRLTSALAVPVLLVLAVVVVFLLRTVRRA